MDDDKLITIAIKHLKVDVPVQDARVVNGLVILTLQFGVEVSCRVSDLETNRKGAKNAKKNIGG